ncbi:MAG: hypothetical protein KC422_24310 [Trueperaceae bacterium]|nr:hypothetical protein [Trueperaceae bacterium]
MKQDLPSRDWQVITDSERANFIISPQSRRFLEPFILEECSVGELAAKLEVDISSALYRVRQLLRLGLIKEVRQEARRGRPIRYYKSVAEGFYVPFSATTYANTESLGPETFGNVHELLIKSIAKAWTEAAGSPVDLGIHIFRHEEGWVSSNITPLPREDNPGQFFDKLLEPDSAAVWDSWGSRKLSKESAKRLQIELANVLDRYPDEADKGNKTYMVRLAMAPLKERL